MPQDWQRYLLLAGLAVGAYVLVLQWNEDYGGVNEEQIVSEAPEFSSQAGGDSPIGLEPREERGDIPDPSLITGNQVSQASEARRGSGKAVHVRTRVLDLWIDLVGGDVVRARLPEHPMSLETPDIAFPLLDRGAGREFVAQSGLVGPDGVDDGAGRATYVSARADYSTNETQSTSTGETLEVVLEMLPKPGKEYLNIEKVFRFVDDDYLAELEYRVTNRSGEDAKINLFAQFKHDGGEALAGESGGLGPRPYVGAALQTNEDRYYKLDFEDIDDGPFQVRRQGGWVAMLQHYFLGAWIPDASETNSYVGRKTGDGGYAVGLIGPEQLVRAGETRVFGAQLYLGPKNQRRLQEISPDLNLTVDYGFLWWLAVPLFSVLDWLHSYVGNWGGAIILLTFLVKLVLYPLSHAGYRSMAKMRQVAPKMKQLQERYSDDRQKLSMEMMALYKREGANPMGGCLPMLLPMPVFIALYWVLYESVELRQAPFALWIQDLSEIDPFFVLPILMGASMFLMQYLNPPPPDPMQARIMKAMPIAFTVLFLFFPSGLVLYWLVNNILSLAQQWYVTRKIEAEADSAKAKG